MKPTPMHTPLVFAKLYVDFVMIECALARFDVNGR